MQSRRKAPRTAKEWVSTQSEADFQAGVVEWAEANGWTVRHIPTSMRLVRDRSGGLKLVGDSGKRGTKGMSDLRFTRELRPGEQGPNLIYAELKTQNGKVEPEQTAEREHLLACGIPAYLWRPSDWPEIERVLARR